MSDVISDIFLVRRNIVSTGQSARAEAPMKICKLFKLNVIHRIWDSKHYSIRFTYLRSQNWYAFQFFLKSTQFLIKIYPLKYTSQVMAHFSDIVSSKLYLINFLEFSWEHWNPCPDFQVAKQPFWHFFIVFFKHF